MAMLDLSVQRGQLLKDDAVLSQLPHDLLEIISGHASSTSFLDAVAAAALIPQITSQLFIHFEAFI